jgi:hypothetical protein
MEIVRALGASGLYRGFAMTSVGWPQLPRGCTELSRAGRGSRPRTLRSRLSSSRSTRSSRATSDSATTSAWETCSSRGGHAITHRRALTYLCASSMVSSGIAAAVSTPADVVKTRLQSVQLAAVRDRHRVAALPVGLLTQRSTRLLCMRSRPYTRNRACEVPWRARTRAWRRRMQAGSDQVSSAVSHPA